MKTWGIIGALFFVAAVTVGYFCNFDGAIIIEIGAAAFGLCSLVIGAIKSGKTKNVKTWKTVLIICFAVIWRGFVLYWRIEPKYFCRISRRSTCFIGRNFWRNFCKNKITI